MQIDVRINDEVVGRIEASDQMQVEAFKQGFDAGKENPTELSTGMTYEGQPELNEWFDTGVNVGQSLAKSGHFVA